jgi:hypothetical protein
MCGSPHNLIFVNLVRNPPKVGLHEIETKLQPPRTRSSTKETPRNELPSRSFVPFVVDDLRLSEFKLIPPEFCILRSSNLGYPDRMDHLEVLRDKVAGLRAEIAEIQRLNQAYRLRGFNGTEAQVSHGERQERLLAIQEELAKVGDLGRRVISLEKMKENRARPHLPPQEKAS